MQLKGELIRKWTIKWRWILDNFKNLSVFVGRCSLALYAYLVFSIVYLYLYFIMFKFSFLFSLMTWIILRHNTFNFILSYWSVLLINWINLRTGRIILLTNSCSLVATFLPWFPVLCFTSPPETHTKTHFLPNYTRHFLLCLQCLFHINTKFITELS